MSLRRTLRDTSGASIVIALVFFLICGIVGSAVVTAASVQAKSVQTHEDMQQAEFTMTSAAELVAAGFGGVDATSGENVVTVNLGYVDGAVQVDATALQNGIHSDLGKGFWTVARVEEILKKRADGGSYVLGSQEDARVEIRAPSSAAGIAPVYGKITVDRDLNFTAELSLERSLAADSRYNMVVSIPCIPTYDISGKLVSFTYGDAVIEKKQGA